MPPLTCSRSLLCMCAESPAALHELLHEVGHALHLTLSSSAAAAQPFLSADASATATSANSGLGTSTAASGAEGVMHFGGLQLPLDVLEVPSSLLQTLAYDPAALARICRRVGSSGGAVRCAAGPSESGIPEAGLGQAAELAEAGVGARIGSREPLGDPMPRHLAEAVAAHLAAENCSGIGTLGKVGHGSKSHGGKGHDAVGAAGVPSWGAVYQHPPNPDVSPPASHIDACDRCWRAYSTNCCTRVCLRRRAVGAAALQPQAWRWGCGVRCGAHSAPCPRVTPPCARCVLGERMETAVRLVGH